MTHNELNKIFESYASTLYKAARRMIDRRNLQFEDKVQDLLILAYEEFLRKGEEGRIMELPLVINYMKLRKKEVQLEMRGYSRTNKTDVYNKRNYYEGKLELHSIDSNLSGASGESLKDVLVENPDIEEEIQASIDERSALESLPLATRELVQLLKEGYTEKEVADRMRVHPETIKMNLLKLMPQEVHQMELALTHPY